MRKVVVKQSDIDNGKPQHMQHCAVARALFRCTGDRCIGVSESYIFTRKGIFLGAPYARISCPARVQRFITRFDAGKKVRPFTFSFDYPLLKKKLRAA